MKRRLTGLIVVGAVVGGLLVGCGGSTGTDDAGTPAPGSSTSPAEPDQTASGDIAPDSTAGASAGDVDGGAAEALPATPVAMDVAPCDLLTAADVEKATGLKVSATTDSPPVTCLFTVDGADVFVSVEDGEGRMVGPASVYEGYLGWVPTGEAVEVDGVGESALYAPSVRGLAVYVGDGQYIALGVNGGFSVLAEPQDALVELAGVAAGQL